MATYQSPLAVIIKGSLAGAAGTAVMKLVDRPGPQAGRRPSPGRRPVPLLPAGRSRSFRGSPDDTDDPPGAQIGELSGTVLRTAARGSTCTIPADFT